MNMPKDKNGNGWAKYLLPMLIPLVAGAVAFGVVQERTGDNRDRTEINRQLVSAVEIRIETRLQRIEHKLDALLLGQRQ